MKVVKLLHEVTKFEQTGLSRCVKTVTEDDVTQLKSTIQQGVISPIFGLTANPVPNGVWTDHKLHKEMSPAERDRYEWFVAGFLYYYDTELRNNAVDHQIYFEWSTNKVTIHMSPPPLQALHDKLSSSANGGTTDPPKPPQPPPPPANH